MRFVKEVQEGKVTNAKNSFQNSITSKCLAQKLGNKNSQTEKKIHNHQKRPEAIIIEKNLLQPANSNIYNNIKLC